MLHRFSIFLLALILIGSMVSCAKSDNPTLPTLSGKNSSSESASRVLWGMYNVTISGLDSSVEIVPIRTTEFTANVTRFMQPPVSPTNMVSISIDPSSTPATGYFVVDVTLKHPFPGLNQYNGFDVRGIFMSDGLLGGIHDPSIVRADLDDSRLLNPDGYTRWWNWPEFTTFGSIFGATEGKLAPPNHPVAIVNPYKYFAQGLDSDDPVTALDTSSRGFFPTIPGTHIRRYEIQFKMNGGNIVFDFNYAVDASWDSPDPSYAPDYPADAFPYTANCQEPFHVELSDTGSTAYWVSPSENGGEFNLAIEVFDWQGGANGNVPGEISGIWLEGDVLGGAVDVLSSANVLPGSTDTSSVFEVSIAPTNLTASGNFEIFGTVESASPDTYEPQVTGGSNFAYPSAHLAAYFTAELTVHSDSPLIPTVIGINPNSGIPDCTPEHVTVTGTNFSPSAIFYLKKTGQSDIIADNIEFIDSTTLEGDLNLLGAAFGAWDVVVENSPGAKATLTNGFTVLDVLYVDGDNAGDPLMDGSKAHPFDTIQKGIDAAALQGNKPVIVDQCATPYSGFALKNSSHVIGCNWNGGTGWAEVKHTNVKVYADSISNATVEGLFFNLTINSGVPAGIGVHLRNSTNIHFTRCRFSGVITSTTGYLVYFENVTGGQISYSEIVDVYHRGPDNAWRNLVAVRAYQGNGFSMHHTEVHSVGYDVWDAGAFGNSTNVLQFNMLHNLDLHNLLIYNIFDKTDCIRPSPNPDPQNAMSVIGGGNINSFDYVGDFNMYNITIDNIRHADTPTSTIVHAGHSNGSYFGLSGGTRTWKNNIVSNIIPTNESMVSGNSSYFGFWVDNFLQPPPSPQPMDYSLAYNLGKPLPPGANTWQWHLGFVNQVQPGTGTYTNQQDINPQYDMTPGANFYHPTNTLISQGADDGTEMGAFGGPEGDWIPLSQQ